MLLVGLMGMLAVGATAFYGFDALVSDPENEGASAVPQPWDGPETGEDSVMDIATRAEYGTGTISEGDSEANTLVGTPNPDQINGYDGDDGIDGMAGRDDLHGEDGQDTIGGSQGEDTLHGGDGHDHLSGGAGSDTLYGGNDDDALAGGTGDDSLVGSNGNDTLDGGAGDDALLGALNDDSLEGGAGQDTLFGGLGDDTLNSADDAETDYLNGGVGDDDITAGSGDIVTTGNGADTVTLTARLANEHEPQVTDFSTEEDSLALIYDDLADPDPEVTIEDDPGQEGRQSVLLNGTAVASLDNAPDLTISHITLIPQSTL